MNSIARFCVFSLLLTPALAAAADDLQYVIRGVDDPLRANVRRHVETVQLGRQARLAENDYADVIADTVRRASEALRPYGYYNPTVSGRIQRHNDESLRLTLDVDRGPPMIVEAAHIELIGEGTNVAELKQWKDEWPLRPGAVLNQVTWEAEKQRAIEDAEARGFMAAEFPEHALELNLNENSAVLRLVLDTGPQYMFGDIDFGEHLLKPGILEFIPRFEKGEPFNSDLLDSFRSDLWATRYFTHIEVVAVERPDVVPPVVDLQVNLETDRKNSYQGSIGVGSDTGLRLQTQWSRHPVSRNGDRLDVGLGWQQRNDEFSFHSNYRLPRLGHQRQYWTAELLAKYENLDLRIKSRPEDEGYINIANGNVSEQNLRLGRLKVRNLKRGNRQYLESFFVQFLNGAHEYKPIPDAPVFPSSDMIDDLLKGTTAASSIGYNGDLTDVRGSGFDTVGRRDRAWLYYSSETFGSDVDFTQAYISTRRIYRKGERWKFVLRAEIGYTDAKVDEFELNAGGTMVDVSVTRLPNFYRFRAGGSNSVRGYGFESLSNNDIGSNHIATASAEIELKVLEKWSAAAFFDIGDAFNHWSNPELRKGVGVGIRWYSIAGPISVDFAKALDIDGEPWRLHFTIGTPLL